MCVESLIASLNDKSLIARIRVEHVLESITGKCFGKDIFKWKE